MIDPDWYERNRDKREYTILLADLMIHGNSCEYPFSSDTAPHTSSTPERPTTERDTENDGEGSHSSSSSSEEE